MQMGAKEPVDHIEPKGEIYVCPACGYSDGFHVSFLMSDGKQEGEIYLICPSCHARYRLGWRVRMEG